MVTTRLAALVEQRVDDLMVVAQDYFGTKLRRPNVDYTLKGTAAGQASIVGLRISLNPILLYENPQEFIDDTVGHEFTHTMVMQKHGIVRYNHGKQWQDYMRAWGIPVHIDHRYDVSTILGRRRKLKQRNTITFTDEDHQVYQQCCMEYRS